MHGRDRMSLIASMSSIVPSLTICERMRLTTSLISLPSFCSLPMILSASRTAAISGIVTTIAQSAAMTAVWKPCSMPAGQSTRM